MTILPSLFEQAVQRTDVLELSRLPKVDNLTRAALLLKKSKSHPILIARYYFRGQRWRHMRDSSTYRSHCILRVLLI
jgi:hypothetical protein